MRKVRPQGANLSSLVEPPKNIRSQCSRTVGNPTPFTEHISYAREPLPYPSPYLSDNHLVPVMSAEALRNDEKVSGRDAHDLRAVAPRRGTPCRPRRDGKRADRQDTTTPSIRPDLNSNLPARPRAGPPPRLSSGRRARRAPAYAAARSASPWPAAGATAPRPRPAAPRPGAVHSLPPTPGHRAGAGYRPAAGVQPRGAPAGPARCPAHRPAAAASHAGHPATAPRPPGGSAPSAGHVARTGPLGYCATSP